jgi:hypothetical protein
MMLLSRFWYALAAAVLAGALALTFMGVHQHDRIRQSDTKEIVEHDRDIIEWALRIDSRRRLDALVIVSGDDQVKNGVVKALGQDKITGDVREAVRKRLGELAQKHGAVLHDEGPGGTKPPTALFAVDARGRVVASVAFDRANLAKEETFELGGFPAVVDALHGWHRDDTWVFDRDSIYRVVVRPIVAAEGAGPVGAAVALRRVDDDFAQIIAKQTQSPVMFYVAPPDADVKVVARAVPDKSDLSFEGATPEAKLLAGDKLYAEQGLSNLQVQGKLTLAYARLSGEAWDLGAGYAVARKVTPLGSPAQLWANVDDSDRRAVPWGLVGGSAVGVLLIGLLFTWLEHSQPIGKLVGEARKFAKGEQDALPLPRLSGPLRKVGADVNEGVERVIAKGGGASRKAADLEQILGPVPAAPQMSAFSFNLDGGGGAAAPAAPASKPSSGGNDLFPNLGPAAAPTAAAPSPAPAPAKPAAPPPRPAAPTPTPAARANDVAAAAAAALAEEEEEATLVAKIPEELMAASATGEARAIETADELVTWKAVFEEFVNLRKKLNEPVTGLSFEKFQVQLRRNKEQLVKQYNCKRVRFTVYEKDGKAALKATPIKE